MSPNRRYKQRSRKHTRLKYAATAVGSTSILIFGLATVGAEDSPSDRNFANRWYLGAGPQLSWLKPRTSDTGFNVDDNTSSGGQIFLGLDLFPRLSVEGYYADQGDAGIGRDNDNTHAGDISYKQYGLSAIAYLFNSRSGNDYSSGYDDEGAYRHEGWSAFGRVGFGGMKNNATSSLNQQRLENTALVLGGGVEYGWENGFAARAEFTSYDKDSKMVGISLLKRFGEPSPYAVAVPAAAAVVAATTPKSTPAMATLDAKNIQFAFNKSDLDQGATLQLDKLANELKSKPGLRLNIEGHTCEIGTVDYNQRLSERRAKSVTKYLTTKGIGAGRLKSKGFGELRPIADNSTEEGRKLNRRVEFKTLQ